MADLRVGQRQQVDAAAKARPLAETLAQELTPEMVATFQKQLEAAGLKPRTQGAKLDPRVQWEAAEALMRNLESPQARANATGRPTRDGMMLYMPQSPIDARRARELDGARAAAQEEANRTGRPVRVKVPAGSMPEIVGPEIDSGMVRPWKDVGAILLKELK